MSLIGSGALPGCSVETLITVVNAPTRARAVTVPISWDFTQASRRGHEKGVFVHREATQLANLDTLVGAQPADGSQGPLRHGDVPPGIDFLKGPGAGVATDLQPLPGGHHPLQAQSEGAWDGAVDPALLRPSPRRPFPVRIWRQGVSGKQPRSASSLDMLPEHRSRGTEALQCGGQGVGDIVHGNLGGVR